MKRFVYGLAAAVAFGVTTANADTLQELVDFNGTIFHLQTGVPGAVVGVLRDGEFAVQGFGETQAGNGKTPNGDSVFRIGSITKAFAGQMLAEAVARHEVGLTDAAAPLLPDRLGEAVARHETIRLIDLATHSAGLPREVPRDSIDPTDPYASITEEAFAKWLEENSLDFTPGSAIAYSNFGFDLLSAALSGAAQQPYPELLDQRITGPIGMTDTGFHLSDSMQSRFMSGHAPDGQVMPDVPTGKLNTGSGGLYSTANDMLRWIGWHLATGDPEAEARFLDHGVYLRRDGKSEITSMDESGRMDGMGLGWVAMNATAERPFILQKAGGLQGQLSYVAFAPDHGTGIFVTINQFDFAAAYAMAEFANAFLAQLSGF